MIRLEGLYKAFGDKAVLRGVDLEIARGETMVVIGQSGSGKSVLLKHIIGLLSPDRGRVFVDDQEITCLDENARLAATRKCGYLFQAAALFDSMTVAENIAFGLTRYARLDRAEVRRVVAECLERVGLRGIEDLMPAELSGGMKKRVGLARAIAYRPEIMLYDEPSAGIDPIRADSINDLINQLKRDMGVTSVVITHDMKSAFKVADRVALLYGGRIVEEGTPAALAASANPVVQQFINGRAAGPITDY
jgi:phospholipid/cholesterol/gamma-HCH transport system ATP-binding protein